VADRCIMLVAVKSDTDADDYLYEFDSPGPANAAHQSLVGAVRRRRAGGDDRYWTHTDGSRLDLDDVSCVRLAAVWSLTYVDDIPVAPKGGTPSRPAPPKPRHPVPSKSRR
jgi:hypothetical protein